jgi:membrane associated rhomboid family serine protease
VIPLHDNIPTRRFPIVTIAIIALNVAVFVFELMLPRYGLTRDGFFYRAGAIPFELAHRIDIPPHDLVPWWATVFTAMFMHGGWLHIGFNMLFLWIFGNNVEDSMGGLRFLVFYLVCGVIAAAAQVAADPSQVGPMIGASGAIAGVLGAYIVLYPHARVLTVVPLVFLFPVFYLPAWLLLGAWFVLQFAQGTLSLGATGGVAYFAHVGGFVAGLVLVMLFAHRRRRAW